MISGKIVSKEIDQNGNIKVGVEYTLTDSSKKIGYTRYNCFNYSEAEILRDIKSHCETLMRKTYNLKQNQNIVAQALPAIEYICESVEVVSKPAVLDETGNIITPEEKITIDDK